MEGSRRELLVDMFVRRFFFKNNHNTLKRVYYGYF